MNFQSIKNFPLFFSVIIHIIIFLIFLVIKINAFYPPKDFVDVTFGLAGRSGSPGIRGTDIKKSKKNRKGKTAKKKQTIRQKEKKVQLPKSKTPNKIKNNKSEKKNPKSGVVLKEKIKKTKSVKKGNKGKKNIGKNNLGYDIEWGGRGQRRIYSFSLPEYPAGVNKEIDIRLRFTILPDGTVGSIFPLIKADTRLEDAAIKSLRQWRFEPLPLGQKKSVQTAVIIFPYRLK